MLPPDHSTPRLTPLPASLRLLETAYDGAIPPELQAQAIASTYSHFLTRLAHAAEARFRRRIQANLQLIAHWRRRAHPHRWHRVQSASQAIGQCRQRAREAFELGRNNAGRD